MILKRQTREQYLAIQAAVFDASPLKDDSAKRAAFLEHAARIFDQEANSICDEPCDPKNGGDTVAIRR